MARHAGDGYLLKPHCRRRCLRKLDDHLTCAGRLRWSRKRLLALVVALALLALLWHLWFFCRRDWSKDTWVTLAPSRLHIYSAWAERRGPVHGVRVVAMLASGGALRGRLLCTLAYTNYSHVQVVAARTEPLWWTGNALDPGYVLCSGDPQLEADEVGLRLVDTVRVHWLPVTHAWKERSNGGNGDGDGSIAACVLSRTGTVSDLKLAEFVAHYLLLGVEHFLFYNQTETRQARRFLDAVVAVSDARRHRFENGA
ncbi:hypothetical protein IscW_ISCW020679 [Ixodes scapularis]|uniref:Uncharacterized protein n=1 Tax=Ixodes scapularis TaxID=6945 RepID=B7Q2H0_IXOSC|nr:hypothetical protein IscW_ISCW020679 [Ixodes scapularis]|eukprot:XP_002410813.1 hypothetical protein IscW_ISCW020679 [Ixodes scapularis]